MDCELFLSPDEEAELTKYLETLYEGVFTREAIAGHLENHVGSAFATYTTEVIRPRLPGQARVLDIGSGFGSCVLAARQAGLDAFGVEVAPFEVEFARRRLRAVRPGDDPHSVYRVVDARRLDIAPASLDAVTMWNVLEHISEWKSVIDVAARSLKPGGLLFIICPNYMAWRQEAHYHVPWRPSFLLPRDKASGYLRSLGRNPAYFESAIFYRTNWEILSYLRARDLEPLELGTLAPRGLLARNLLRMLCHPTAFLRFYNPFKHSVEVAARKLH